MISITTQQSNMMGAVVLQQSDMTPESIQTIFDMTRRGSRVKTLDLKSVLVNCGVTSSDLSLQITIKHKAMSKIFILRTLMSIYPVVNISIPLGFFQASIMNIVNTNDGYQCTILII